MIGNELLHHRNKILFILISIFYLTQITINIFIEGFASIFPPAYLFILFGSILAAMIYIKINPKITMYGLVSCMYVYFYFLLKESPYLADYLFMWLALPLSAIYQNARVVIMSGIASIMLTFYAFFYLHNEIFPNVVTGDFAYLVLFGVFMTAFLLTFIYRVKDANAKLQDLAYLDPLTGAANRLFLKKRFDVLKESKVLSIALLFLDMNGFKKINDTYGHEVGDQLLEVIVRRMNGVLRESDLLCRLGGDEFVILLSDIDDAILKNLSERIQSTLAQPITLNNQILQVSASIGWFYETETAQADLEAMIKEADTAMYKEKGRELIDSHTPEVIEV
ncbi:GGDEF domain-containing protein [Ureibacillus aquaedulcis]|uniref:GGDEF domain-containing protein n=1 Tax=Ureibacillus aquaedulcis TaxID=3058421 RepID=A0ABT8GTJ1_9BACL|nr:GGDEF domain-containing protein [Ureibacillus sp. BA0131]MDN4494733.1 GGDEF domain-containing protein [Ureibacillus sp. BA0131]